MRITIDIDKVYGKPNNALLEKTDDYVKKVLKLAGEGNIITLTGGGPIWLYLIIAHALHGKARKLYYRTPAIKGKRILVFDHSAI
jgi:hypothetical protein